MHAMEFIASIAAIEGQSRCWQTGVIAPDYGRDSSHANALRSPNAPRNDEDRVTLFGA